MADLSHELGALRFVVDSPLSSKVAMFNNQVQQHKSSQLLNPFSQTDGRSSPKPDITKDDYGKPLAGSLTEMRGQKANMHVLREMLELCQIIDSEGYDVKDEPTMRVITFGELFNIYNYISDKCVGILLRARKHKLVDFEGEMLFQRRDDDVPIFLLKPIAEIRHETNDKIESIKRCGSPAPQATSVLLDKKANGLSAPNSRQTVSRTPTSQSSKSGSPVKEIKAKVPAPAVPPRTPAPVANPAENPKIRISGDPEPENKAEEKSEPAQSDKKEAAPTESIPKEEKVEEAQAAVKEPAVVSENQVQTPEPRATIPAPEIQDVSTPQDDLPTVVVEATAVYVRRASEASGGNPAPEAAVA